MVEQALVRFLDGVAEFDRLALQPSTLLALAVFFAIAFLLAVREAGAWFFGLRPLAKDLKTLRASVRHLEQEVEMLEELMAKMTSVRRPTVSQTVNEETLATPGQSAPLRAKSIDSSGTSISAAPSP